jgi:type I pantothenate kinase
MAAIDRETMFSPYLSFTREHWAQLRETTPLPLVSEDLNQIRGINERISLDEVSEIYLPLSKLLNLYVSSMQSLYGVTSAFLGTLTQKVPYIIGIAGSVAVGKSTTARLIQTLLSHWPNHPKVDLVTTDGFLFPNQVLERRGLMNKKGFPESYDVRRLVRFLADIKSGRKEVTAPVYSHLTYDIVPDQVQTVRQPDILIIEGVNVLQGPGEVKSKRTPSVFVSDFFDFSIYIDASEHHIQNWYIERFQVLRRTAFLDQNSYFHRYAKLTEHETEAVAKSIWNEINSRNLRENILPSRERAQLILEKGTHHSVQRVRLRKL